MTLLPSGRRTRRRKARATRETSETLVRVRGGYSPSVIHAQAGMPVRLVFLREETASCSEQVVFPAFGKSAMLPPGRKVPVDLLACPPGSYEFTCAMGILRGCLVVSRAESDRRGSASGSSPEPQVNFTRSSAIHAAVRLPTRDKRGG